MIYNVDQDNGELMVKNDSLLTIFIINNSHSAKWVKWDYNQNGKQIYYENSDGFLGHYKIL